MDQVREIEKILSRYELRDRAPTLVFMAEALERIGYAATPFAQSSKKHKVILVAGTNGKGSTSATLATLLEAAGERVGLFTSPHLMSITERFNIASQDVSESQFAEAFAWVFPHIEDLPLSRFEILTLIALYLFAFGKLLPPVERLILEVGVGGRFDPTNAVPHDFAVLTRLGLDHVKLLGGTLEQIAWNKFGVVSAGCTVVHTALDPQLTSLKNEIIEQTKSHWFAAETGELLGRPGRPPSFRLKSKWGTADLQLPGARGAENTMLALTAFEKLGYQPAQFLRAVERVVWPGRMEKVSDTPCPLYLSGDHNEQGIQSLIELLPSFEYETLHVLVGIGLEKEVASILQPLANLPRAQLYLTETTFKERKLADYGVWLNQVVDSAPNATEMLTRIQARAKPQDMIIVTGSLYLVGELRRAITGCLTY